MKIWKHTVLTKSALFLGVRSTWNNYCNKMNENSKELTCHLQLERLVCDCRAQSWQRRVRESSQRGGPRGGGRPARGGGAARGGATDQCQQRSPRVVLVGLWWRLPVWQNRLWKTKLKWRTPISMMCADCAHLCSCLPERCLAGCLTVSRCEFSSPACQSHHYHSAPEGKQAKWSKDTSVTWRRTINATDH